MPTVSVKWQKQTFPAVEIDTDQPPYVFKCQLFDLTGVPPERQKILLKGELLKDDGEWAKYGIKEGQKLMMMGTADAIPDAPKEKTVFLEDLPEDQRGSKATGYTAGLVNLGNTCYLNSTLQCLHTVPELKGALKSYSNILNTTETDLSSHNLTVATRDLFQELDRSSNPVSPFKFLTLLRSKFPQFSQQDNSGFYMQQDAEECWTQLVYTLSKGLRTVGTDDEKDSAASVKELFGVDLSSVVKCAETGEQSSDGETVYTLKCHISVGVNHLVEGLKQGFVSEFEKTSPTLGRTALYVKESSISKLPQYLTVQFVRFFWKRESSSKAKILRRVEYPLTLDVYEFCSEELKEKLKLPRKLLQAQEDLKAGLAKAAKGKERKEEGAVDEEMRDASSSSSLETVALPGKDEQQTGIFDLVAVLTHKGRSADSGHYVAWVKQESGKWVEFDDENPIPQREEDITKLSGGGDWHMAYICLYKARLYKSDAGAQEAPTSSFLTADLLSKFSSLPGCCGG
ncbi:hypothetical protein R1sor_009733 [Riccia sorocarpa]|uniref:Ubiquitin carboxyl-terminal hydrolase n=1 Tax=Riccia sorocarpa TaxID=122646 RepID=A0ABD3HVY4_9MARC